MPTRWTNACEQLEAPDREQAQPSVALKALLPDVMEVLERRRLAGTLLYGKCAPHEVDWSRQFGRHERGTVEIADAWPPFVGYDAYLRAARLAFMRLL